MTGLKVLAAGSLVGICATSAAVTDPWTKMVVDAPLIAILGWLIVKTIPKISDDHRRSTEKLSDDNRESYEKLANKIESGQRRTNDLLEQAFRAKGDTP